LSPSCVYKVNSDRVWHVLWGAGMGVPVFQAQGIRHKAYGKLQIGLGVPCALRP